MGYKREVNMVYYHIMGRAKEGFYKVYGVFSEAADVMGIGQAREFKKNAIAAVQRGVDTAYTTLSAQPQDYGSYFPVGLHALNGKESIHEHTWVTSGHRVALPKGQQRIAGTDLRVTGITLLQRDRHPYFTSATDTAREKPQKSKPGDGKDAITYAIDDKKDTVLVLHPSVPHPVEKAIQVSLGTGNTECTLTVGEEEGRGYVSYRDSTFFGSEPAYYPNRDASRPPHRNAFHTWRDYMVAGLEEIAVALVVDSALVTALGEGKGLNNTEELLAVRKKLSTQILAWEKQGLSPTPHAFHPGISKLFAQYLQSTLH